MRVKKLTTEPLDLNDYEFEDCLVTDDLLVDYFNLFLSLPTFPEPIRFNKEYGVFEVVNDAQKCLTNQIKALLRTYKPPNPIYDAVRKAAGQFPTVEQPKNSQDINVDTSFTVMCLDREQGIQWIKQERLPAFLQSDCYFEYRLAKLMSQVEWSRSGMKLQIDPTYCPWPPKKEPTPIPSAEDENEKIMRTFYVSLGQASVTQTKEWFTLAKNSQEIAPTYSLSRPLTCSQTWANVQLSVHAEGSTLCSGSSSSLGIGPEEEDVSSPLFSQRSLSRYHHTQTKGRENIGSISERPKSMNDNCFVCIPESPSYTPLATVMDLKCESGVDTDDSDEDDGDCGGGGGDEERKETESQDPHTVEVGLIKYGVYNNKEQTIPTFKNVEEFAAAFVDSAMQSAFSLLFDKEKPPEGNVPKLVLHRLSRVYIYDLSDKQPPELTDVHQLSEDTSHSIEEDGKKHDLSDSIEDDSLLSEYGTEEDSDDGRDPLTVRGRHYDFRSQKGFERFKKFLLGTSGEKYWLLWIDIERLKVIKGTTRKQRHLKIMKHMYLVSSGEYFLNTEILSRLGMLDAALWTTDNLCLIQSDIMKPLLLYWGPRYCLTGAGAVVNASVELKMWRDRQLRPRTNVDPCPRNVTLLPLRAKSCIPKITFSIPQKTERTPAKASSEFGAISSEKPNRLLNANLVSTTDGSGSVPCSSTHRPDNSKKRQRLQSARSDVSHSSDFADISLILETNDEKKDPSIKQLPDKNRRSSSVLGSSQMESMLQALHYDSRAGYFFTQFCELSGNKLWNHGVHFWFDLQDYHKLFYQETFHLFELHRQAQVLYSAYIAYGASMDIGVDQPVRSKIYQKLDPPFEDLFDPAEEYILTLLLVPWMQMAASDRTTYKKGL